MCDLHRVHGFDLDTEVAYAVKVHASFADVESAVGLHCFDADSDGNLIASAVVVEPWFLNSRTFAHRLVLNALTTPHFFLGGDSSSRIKDYVFDVDRMVSFNGNTGVYLQYAHTRIRSLLRKTRDPDVTIDPTIELQPAERALALELDAYGSALTDVSETLEPHKLCGYLYDLARDFTNFYEACHVLGAEDPIRSNRLALCQLTARTLQHGLGLLGISAPERM